MRPIARERRTRRRLDVFVVSPENSRKSLGKFLKRAKKQLLIYDPKISDKEMIRILRERAKAGVEIRIIGRITARLDLTVKKSTSVRLHTRTIIRDQHQAFIGSQSLRSAELDSRRELGLIVRESKIIKKLIDTFESDWKANETTKNRETNEDQAPEVPKKDSEKAAKVLAQDMRPISLTLKSAVKKAVAGEMASEQQLVKDAVKKIMKKAIKDGVKEASEERKAISRRFSSLRAGAY